MRRLVRLSRRSLTTGAFSLLAFLLAGGAGSDYADRPADWYGGGDGYELSRDDMVKHAGQACGSVKSTGDGAKGFGTLTQGFLADNYQGKRLRMSGFVKTEGVEGWAGLWMRVDGKDKTDLAFDNMSKRSIKGSTDWQRYEVVLDVPADAHSIFFGFLVAGKGQGWVDDIAFEAVGKDVMTTDLKLHPTDREGNPPEGLPEEARNLDFER
jgi:hypothetical protein